MDKFFIFLLCFTFCSAKIKITKLSVPAAILYGSKPDAVLDCDFDSGGDNVTEIKWFLNENTLIYQWLPLANKNPQTPPQLKDSIDVDFKITNDERTMYRALHIVNLTPEFTGNYTCKVSSIDSEDSKTKSMIIYVIPDVDYDTDNVGAETDDDDDNDDGIDDDDDFLDIVVSEETSQITCSASGFFPQPNLTLFITNDNQTEIIYREDDEIFEVTEDGYYNVTATLEYDTTNLTDTVMYFCELNIPGTPFNISEEGIIILDEDTEIQVVEDYLDILLNTTNSTESSFEGSKEVETQIEEEIEFISTTTKTPTDHEDPTEEVQSFYDSASANVLPNLVSTIILTTLSRLLIF